MSLDVWPAMPRLAVGSHPAGSGKGCVMNVISWGNGDVEITDMPTCTHPALAKAAVVLNDRICTHRDDGDLLCVDCSTIMFGYEPLLVGTAAPEDPTEAKRLAVAMTVSLRPLVEPLWRPQDREVCAAAFDAAQAWLDCPCKTHTAAAYTYAYTSAASAAFFAAFAATATAAYTFADAADAASDAASAYTAASASASASAAASDAASAAFFAASAAAAAYTAASASASASAAFYAASAAFFADATDPRVVLDTLIEVYYAHTGRPRPVPDPQRLNRALTAAGLV